MGRAGARAAALALLGAAVAWWWGAGTGREPPWVEWSAALELRGPAVAPVNAGPGAAAPLALGTDGRVRDGASVAPAGLPALPPLPASLVGTEVDGGFVVDEAGRFVVTRDALDLFDYFLTASGEEPLATIRARIEAEIEARLPATARPAARDLLERYLAYRDGIRALHAEGLEAAPLERRLQRVREVRRAYFAPEEHDALFGQEEARWRVEVAWRRVASDPALSAAERARRLEALDAELPEPVREARREALGAVTLLREEAALRATGAAPGEIDALREARVGRAAADRLAELDRARAAWQGRMDAWLAEKARLEAAGASPAELEAARAARFEGPELVRARALERLVAPAR